MYEPEPGLLTLRKNAHTSTGVVQGMGKIEDKVEDAIDSVGGEGTTDKIKGKVDQAIGKTKEVVGDALDNKEMQAEGIAQHAKGKGEEAVGEVRSAAAILVDVVKEGAHMVSDAVHNVLHRDHHDEDEKPKA